VNKIFGIVFLSIAGAGVAAADDFSVALGSSDTGSVVIESSIGAEALWTINDYVDAARPSPRAEADGERISIRSEIDIDDAARRI
jgi:hypothetical protein